VQQPRQDTGVGLITLRPECRLLAAREAIVRLVEACGMSHGGLRRKRPEELRGRRKRQQKR
jgi:hypothetical protein